MFGQEWKRSMKDMVHRKEFILALTLSVLFVLIPFFIDLFSFYKTDILFLKPAWFCWGVNGSGYASGSNDFGSMFNTSWAIKSFDFFVLPFIASLAYAYCCYDDRKSGVLKVLIPHTGRNAYYLANACTVFFGAFLVVLLPMILDQLILCIFCPLSTPYIMSSNPLVDDYITGLGKTGAPLLGLHLNHPYLFNALYCVIPAITGGLMALLSYSLSLFMHKSRFLVLTLPGISWIVFGFVIANIGYWEIAFNRLVVPYNMFYPWVVFTIILVLVNGMAIGGKLLFTKDELL